MPIYADSYGGIQAGIQADQEGRLRAIQVAQQQQMEQRRLADAEAQQQYANRFGQQNFSAGRTDAANQNAYMQRHLDIITQQTQGKNDHWQDAIDLKKADEATNRNLQFANEALQSGDWDPNYWKGKIPDEAVQAFTLQDKQATDREVKAYSISKQAADLLNHHAALAAGSARLVKLAAMAGDPETTADLKKKADYWTAAAKNIGPAAANILENRQYMALVAPTETGQYVPTVPLTPRVQRALKISAPGVGNGKSMPSMPTAEDLQKINSAPPNPYITGKVYQHTDEKGNQTFLTYNGSNPSNPNDPSNWETPTFNSRMMQPSAPPVANAQPVSNNPSLN